MASPQIMRHDRNIAEGEEIFARLPVLRRHMGVQLIGNKKSFNFQDEPV